MPSSKRLLTGITLLAVWLLCGCAATVPEVVKTLPPAATAQPCQEPAGDVSTNGGMANYVLALKDALRGCAAQVEALGAWMQATK